MFVSNVTVLIEKEFRSVRRKGLKEGRRLGRMEMLTEIVTNADKLGQTDEMIAAIAGISMEELYAVRESLRSKAEKIEE